MHCTYCCNEIPRFRDQFRSVLLGDVDFGSYTNICVSGGEPLLELPLLKTVLERIPEDKTIILYSNGTLLNHQNSEMLDSHRVKHINIGLHLPTQFDHLIQNCTDAVIGTKIKVRFQAQDIYQDRLTQNYPLLNFRFWKMNDCDRGNEDRLILQG